MKFMPLTNSVTLSIVSHGHGRMIRSLIEQLNLHSHMLISKLVLTINISEPKDWQGLNIGFPIEEIHNIRPRGFGQNHNTAFARCESSWFLVLNPDIIIEEDILTPLLEAAQSTSGIVTPRIKEPGKKDREHHRRVLTPIEIVMRHRNCYVPPITPDWVPGMFMLFRSEAFKQVNGFDEKFFMYAEDFDICARAKMAGWKLQVLEDLTVIHDARRASRAVNAHFMFHLVSLLKLWTSRTFWEYMHFARGAP
jgi:N-acetylglucosaminyl-diphospho-decaprenol L-rhamnosyltransferase